MSALEGFLTGFLNKRTEINDTRRQEADDYYNQQMERARLFGQEGLKTRRERVQQATSLASNLRDNANVPEHIIRAVANEGLDNLVELEKIWQKAASDGVTLDAGYWEQAVPTAMEVSSQNGEPLGKFLERAGGLYLDDVKNGQATPTSARQTVWDALQGRRHMDQARNRLGTTEVAFGMTADDLNRLEAQGDDPRPDKSGGFGINHSFTAAREAEAAAKAKNDKPLSPDQAINIQTKFDKDVAERTERYMKEASLNVGGLSAEDLLAQETAIRERAQTEVYQEYSDIPGVSGVLDQLPGIRPGRTAEPEEEDEEAVPAPTQPQAGWRKVGRDRRSGRDIYEDSQGNRKFGPAATAEQAAQPVAAPQEEAVAPPQQEAKSGFINAIETYVNGSAMASQEELDAAFENMSIQPGETPPAEFTLSNGAKYTFVGIDGFGLANYTLSNLDEAGDAQRAIKIPVLQ